LSGNGNDGFFVSNPLFNEFPKSYFTFDGVDDRIEGNLDYNESPPGWTGILWAKQNASILTNGSGRQGLELGFNFNTNIVGGNVEDTSGGDVSTNFDVPENLISEWNMIVGTYDQNNLSFYINGKFVNENTVGSRTIATFNEFYINDTLASVMDTGVFGSSNAHVAGDVAIAQIYTRALTEAEIKQNFNALRGRYGI
jgi:hypothetical protein